MTMTFLDLAQHQTVKQLHRPRSTSDKALQPTSSRRVFEIVTIGRTPWGCSPLRAAQQRIIRRHGDQLRLGWHI
jgi:hypothetical protein